MSGLGAQGAMVVGAFKVSGSAFKTPGSHPEVAFLFFRYVTYVSQNP